MAVAEAVRLAYVAWEGENKSECESNEDWWWTVLWSRGGGGRLRRLGAGAGAGEKDCWRVEKAGRRFAVREVLEAAVGGRGGAEVVDKARRWAAADVVEVDVPPAAVAVLGKEVMLEFEARLSFRGAEVEELVGGEGSVLCDVVAGGW